MAANNSGSAADIMDDAELDEILSSYNFDMDTVEEAKKFPCAHCPKVCLSKRGLTRHTNVKHAEEVIKSTTTTTGTTLNVTQKKIEIQDVLPYQQFRQILRASLEKVIEESKKFYPNLEPKFKSIDLRDASQLSKIYHHISKTVLAFKPDSEKFLPDFIKLFRNGGVIDGLYKIGHCLLASELSCKLSYFLTTSKINSGGSFVLSKSISFTQKDREVITYIGASIVRTIYRRFRFSPNHDCYFNKEGIKFLNACKFVEGSETNIDHHKLIASRDRGGMSKINIDAVSVFTFAGTYFLSATQDYVTHVDSEKLVNLMLNELNVLAYFGSIRNTTDVQTKIEVALNIFGDMLLLYFRCRTHQYCKNKVQKHKMDKDRTKENSLRAEIKKLTSTLDEGH